VSDSKAVTIDDQGAISILFQVEFRRLLNQASIDAGMTPSEWVESLAVAHLRGNPRIPTALLESISSLTSAFAQLINILPSCGVREADSVAARAANQAMSCLNAVLQSQRTYWGGVFDHPKRVRGLTVIQGGRSSTKH
jgi:hypothetical protein